MSNIFHKNPILKKVLGNSSSTNNSAAGAAKLASNLDTQLLPAYEREYYNIPDYMKQSNTTDAAGRSAANAETRGGQYAQENRINQIRAKTGASAFSPIEDKPGVPDPTAQAFLSRNLALANGATPQEAAKLLPDRSSGNYRSTIGQLGPAIQAQGQMSQDQINSEVAGIQPYLQNRYSNDAVRAGTLTNSPQSQMALNADVNAGSEGARKVLQGDSNLLSSALSPTYQSNPKLFPTTGSAATPQTPLPIPNAAPDQLPINSSNPNNLISGKAGLSPQTRLQQIQSRRVS